MNMCNINCFQTTINVSQTCYQSVKKKTGSLLETSMKLPHLCFVFMLRNEKHATWTKLILIDLHFAFVPLVSIMAAQSTLKRPAAGGGGGGQASKKRPAASTMRSTLDELRQGTTKKDDAEENHDDDDGEGDDGDGHRDKGKGLKFAQMKSKLPLHIVELYDTVALEKTSPRAFRTMIVNQLFKKTDQEGTFCKIRSPFFKRRNVSTKESMVLRSKIPIQRVCFAGSILAIVRRLFRKQLPVATFSLCSLRTARSFGHFNLKRLEGKGRLIAVGMYRFEIYIRKNHSNNGTHALLLCGCFCLYFCCCSAVCCCFCCCCCSSCCSS